MTEAPAHHRDHVTELAVLYEIATLSKHIRSLDRLFDLTLDKAIRLLGAEIAVFYLYDANDAHLHPQAARGVRLNKVCPTLQPATPEVDLATQTLVWAKDLQCPCPIDPLQGHYPVQAVLGVPLKSKTGSPGWLYAARLKRKAFEAHEVALYEVLADQAASTLEITLAWECNQQQQAELTAANAQMAAMLAEVTQAYQQQELLLQTIKVLSTPVLIIADTVLLVPLIGHIDSERSELIKMTILEAISHNRAQVTILDITGISQVDEYVTQTLLETAQAAHLLGAQVVLCGITPSIAETMVKLDLNPCIATTSDLRTAMTKVFIGQAKGPVHTALPTSPGKLRR